MNKPNLIPCFLLAAGRGERMRPLTDELPKPLLTIKNKSLLAWHVEALSSAGIQDVVINHAWLGRKIEEALGNGSQFGLNITYSPETSALETAGGIRKALPLLNPRDYFLVINGDVFSPNLPIQQLLNQAPNLRSMSSRPLAHLLMVPNPAQHPEGDFYIKDSQVANEPLDGAEKLTFSGIGLYHRDLFKDLELDVPTKLAPILREAMSKNRVSGEKYTGPWHDVGTPQRLQELNAANE
ncbi:Nucleoside-diphosphate-sugar pyrophosphorylase involved in lipopolysaccharide biosynthesis/translation initiation factor 2B, gamma/epsilon subunits (eIF-2Bgamma/eIF-2Bepsilon) [Polynucleobacter duraquae]|uniref:Nucleoside-diphosphate-sugar pyrophosphorylase involved in lipopolysaccharide biosynthesis/translation initiation factor 2B, gamma/epsilon subunits (eIF-2Bgamma/eIF-2Bepsilon) n=1 Tax=Polynucleobacter duraquae TaxID=1835254 RepID=A0A0E3ZNI9_9BURK|nr:nucleotidyltransferase family protein [Polynucleobacter duraquae]AKD26190.1 Nucleoside-diphosphate-sugar pyrophosphorylase involved in lipopolysaccharide biosynthesis/translation initiation factor 2B, gamma/epsilon subunits (eIF-2Bgamma/eIF-2Bepsilon) [Polynucleobacter duraquae]